MKVAIILNSKAGSVDGNSPPENLISLFKAHGADAEVFAVGGKDLQDAAKRAADSGFDVVVAAGGDGTVSAVTCALVGMDTVMGVLPLGTLNHFSKDAGIPAALEDAVKLIATGTAQPVDVAEVNGMHFINNSSIGLYPKMVKERDKQQEQLSRGKWPAMFSAAVMVFQRLPVIGVRLKKDDNGTVRTAVHRTPFVFIGNNAYEMNVFTLGTRKSIQGGKLSLYTARDNGLGGFLKIFWHILLGRIGRRQNFQTEDFEFQLLDELEIETKRKTLDVSLDGEVRKMKPPLHYKLHPKALRVVMPQQEPETTGEADAKDTGAKPATEVSKPEVR
ncbi:MAG: diacylglycerol kinase family lipid kinase [Rhizobacter sp.]|nr:diacylglycerol kinase family lipid kinase [Chlorobiales bacterium]